jgi:plasmid replication initiation protein
MIHYAAEFTNGSIHRPPTITFNEIREGRRVHMNTFSVIDKRQARREIREYNLNLLVQTGTLGQYVAWNF